MLRAHHFWLAAGPAAKPYSPPGGPALELVRKQLNGFGSRETPSFGYAGLDRRSKHSLYPADGAPKWQVIDHAQGMEGLCWAYQIDDITATDVGIRSEAASLGWFEQAAAEIATPQPDPVLLGSCFCRIVRGPQDLEPEVLLPGMLGEDRLVDRSTLALSNDRLLRLYQTVDEANRRIDLLAVLPLEEDADADASVILNDVIPDFARLLLKISIVSQNWEKVFRHELDQAEQALARSDLAPKRRDLEDELHRMVRIHHRLAQHFALLRHQAQSVSTNVANLKRLAKNLSLRERGWFQTGLRSAKLAKDQLERDLDYFETRVHETEARISAIRTKADLQRVRAQEHESAAMDRRAYLLVMVGLVLAALQILDERTTLALVSLITGSQISADIGVLNILLAKLSMIAIAVIAFAIVLPNLVRVAGHVRKARRRSRASTPRVEGQAAAPSLPAPRQDFPIQGQTRAGDRLDAGASADVSRQ